MIERTHESDTVLAIPRHRVVTDVCSAGLLSIDVDLRQLRNAAGAALSRGDQHAFGVIATLADGLYTAHFGALS